MNSVARFIVAVNGNCQNFLSVKETPKGDLIVSLRGKRHTVPIPASPEALATIDIRRPTISSITIHPNLESTAGSITVHYKDKTGEDPLLKMAGGALGVRLGDRLHPVITSIGRNVSSPNLTIKSRSSTDRYVELWPGQGLNLTSDSLAYSLLVANKDINFIFPEDFPRNVECLRFEHFQVFLIYWLFNFPTKLRCSTLTHHADQYPVGLELHEALNFTNDVTQAHLGIYASFPDLPNQSSK